MVTGETYANESAERKSRTYEADQVF